MLRLEEREVDMDIATYVSHYLDASAISKDHHQAMAAHLQRVNKIRGRRIEATGRHSRRNFQAATIKGAGIYWSTLGEEPGSKVTQHLAFSS